MNVALCMKGETRVAGQELVGVRIYGDPRPTWSEHQGIGRVPVYIMQDRPRGIGDLNMCRPLCAATRRGAGRVYIESRHVPPVSPKFYWIAPLKFVESHPSPSPPPLPPSKSLTARQGFFFWTQSWHPGRSSAGQGSCSKATTAGSTILPEPRRRDGNSQRKRYMKYCGKKGALASFEKSS